MVIFLITFFLIYASDIKCISVETGVSTTANSNSHPIRFVKLTTERLNSTTVLITWTSREYNDFQHATLQFRPLGEADWQSLILNFTGTPAFTNSSHSRYLALSNPCLSYEIRLRATASNNGGGKYYFSETVTSNSPTIPSRTRSTLPLITKNFYNNQTDSIELRFSIENHTLATWPLNSRQLTTEVHVIECGKTEGEDFVAPVPSVQWMSSSVGSVQFAEPYPSYLRAGNPCKVMIVIRGPAKVCDRSVTIEGELLDNAALAELSCATTANAPCTDSKRKKARPPKCNPEVVDASKATAGYAGAEMTNEELRVRWDFGNTTSDIAPRKFILRYGYTEVPADADPLLAMLVPMHEIDLFEVDGVSKSATLRINKTATAPESARAQMTLQRFYRISVCAVYGNDTSTEEHKINWGIIPTFPVKTDGTPKGRGNDAQGRCRCDELSSTAIDSVILSTTTVPPIISEPSNPYENYWMKVAPLLAVFTVMTVVNLVLLMASYYYYRKARQLNAIK